MRENSPPPPRGHLHPSPSLPAPVLHCSEERDARGTVGKEKRSVMGMRRSVGDYKKLKSNMISAPVEKS